MFFFKENLESEGNLKHFERDEVTLTFEENIETFTENRCIIFKAQRKTNYYLGPSSD